MPASRRGLSTAEAVLGSLCLLIVLVALGGLVGPCETSTTERWTHEVFFALHEAGALRTARPDRAPTDAPPGDLWVRAHVFRCRRDHTEFVGYHTRRAVHPDEGFEVTRVALPGGPWHFEGDPRAFDIMRPACPACGEGGRTVEEIAPAEAETILNAEP